MQPSPTITATVQFGLDSGLIKFPEKHRAPTGIVATDPNDYMRQYRRLKGKILRQYQRKYMRRFRANQNSHGSV